jgi:quercetin dioxygenase-like cupin family protein
MSTDETARRDILGTIAAALPLTALLARAGDASAQPAAGTAQAGTSPVRVDTNGLTARIKFEEVISGPLAEVNGRFKLRVTELVLEPGGHVGEHNHIGPGIRQVTMGQMTYVLPNRTIVYNPGDFFFESGDVNHTVYNRTDAPMIHLLFEILPADLKGPSLIPVRHH